MTGFPGLGLLRSLRPDRCHQLTTCLPFRRAGCTAVRATPDGYHVHLESIDERGVQLYPCGIANGYAVDLHRGLQTQAKQTQPGVPLPLAAGRARTANQPESTGLELVISQEA